eukprot:6214601-Pleurochrysis_carterae.AAC.2
MWDWSSLRIEDLIIPRGRSEIRSGNDDTLNFSFTQLGNHQADRAPNGTAQRHRATKHTPPDVHRHTRAPDRPCLEPCRRSAL